jgi:hypothetical protein
MPQVEIDELLTAYAAACTSALEGTGCRVYDGPKVTGADPVHSLSIGHTPIFADGTLSKLRTQAMDTVRVIRNAIRGDSPLGLNLAWGRVTGLQYTPSADSTGSRVVLIFDTVFQSRVSAS